MNIPIFGTFSAGEKVTAAKLNTNIRDAGNFFLGVPVATVTNSANQAVNTGANLDPILYDTEEIDNDTIHSTASSTGRLTILTPGIYVVAFNWRYQASSTTQNYTDCRIALNAASVLARDTRPWVTSSTIPGSCGTINTGPIRFVAGDYVTSMTAHGGASNLQLAGGAATTTNNTTRFSVFWLAA